MMTEILWCQWSKIIFYTIYYIMEKLLMFLQGKKWVIASLIWLVSAYLATKWILAEPEVLLIGWLSTLIFWAASYETNKILKKKKGS